MVVLTSVAGEARDGDKLQWVGASRGLHFDNLMVMVLPNYGMTFCVSTPIFAFMHTISLECPGLIMYFQY